MDRLDPLLAARMDRRRLLGHVALGTGGLAAPALAQQMADLHLPGGNDARGLTSAFPGKGTMILQRMRPPLLETPLDVFDRGIFTPNDQFFVRWHWSDIPTSVDVDTFRLRIGGLVEKPVALSLAQLLRLPRIEYAAVNQCSGNSRGFFQPRVPGAQWGHGAMGNAKWTGVRLRDVLDLAGVRRGAVQVRFGALDQPAVPDGPDFEKSLALDHARDGEVMIAFLMNGEQLPMLNGFPLRLVVPGWYSTYWIKALNAIDVLAAPDEGYWMAKAYKIPTAPGADVAPGSRDFPTRPIGAMIPRSWMTSLPEGQVIAYEPEISVGGIAMGGNRGVAGVAVSSNGGASWRRATLGPDEGRYSFRRWDAKLPLVRGRNTIAIRCWNAAGVAQPFRPIWNPGGYMRGNVETTTIVAA